jgi:hypothetical protein
VAGGDDDAYLVIEMARKDGDKTEPFRRAIGVWGKMGKRDESCVVISPFCSYITKDGLGIFIE